ncbi:MAG: hypothetical protein ABI231_01315, partial [Candidatus Tumulicola sp.]
LAPATRAFDLPEVAPCATARSQGALLIAVVENDRTPASNARRLAAARACGRVRYDDATAVVSGG